MYQYYVTYVAAYVAAYVAQCWAMFQRPLEMGAPKQQQPAHAKVARWTVTYQTSAAHWQ
jgi:hypothetical protein